MYTHHIDTHAHTRIYIHPTHTHTCIYTHTPTHEYTHTHSTVIIDEATQAVEPACLIPLHQGTQRLIMVGDQVLRVCACVLYLCIYVCLCLCVCVLVCMYVRLYVCNPTSPGRPASHYGRRSGTVRVCMFIRVYIFIQTCVFKEVHLLILNRPEFAPRWNLFVNPEFSKEAILTIEDVYWWCACCRLGSHEQKHT